LKTLVFYRLSLKTNLFTTETQSSQSLLFFIQSLRGRLDKTTILLGLLTVLIKTITCCVSQIRKDINYTCFCEKPAMKWPMVFDLPVSPGKSNIIYTLRVLCVSNERSEPRFARDKCAVKTSTHLEGLKRLLT